MNTTVFERHNRDPALKGRVAAFALWNAFGRIINVHRRGVPVYDGWDRGVAPSNSARSSLLRELYATTIFVLSDVAFDVLMQQSLLEYLDTLDSRVLFVGYGEPDEWAHAVRDDLYVRSARNINSCLPQRWARAQADPRIRNTTTMIIATDHGRGGGAEWTEPGSRERGRVHLDGSDRLRLASPRHAC